MKPLKETPSIASSPEKVEQRFSLARRPSPRPSEPFLAHFSSRLVASAASDQNRRVGGVSAYASW